ncbi:hypothetical protein GYMLUDRAFT_67179 [Collybiopsis luxurians FD-317 M1]|nr:hypothetical protein GYMLUDRAFT_67179 [Collybiopsis luxurians FD-317 M1]
MSDFASYAAADNSHFDLFSSSYINNNKHSAVDFTSIHDDLVLAPTNDEFDSELDALIEGIDFDLLPVSNPQAFQYRQPTASAFTFSSSESSYDSARSESSYSPRDSASNYSFIPELDSEFQRFGVDSPAQALDLSSLDCIDPAAFNTMTSPPHSPVVAGKRYGHHRSRSSFSDYGPSTKPANYFDQLANYSATASIDQFPLVPSIPLVPFSTEEVHKGNPRRKYKCTICPRAFDRAFNLKTHLETHNPNRPKPYVCPHSACLRAFSRKHDLGRHLTSIHREDSSKPIGVGKADQRIWCDACGKSSVSTDAACNCVKSDEVK